MSLKVGIVGAAGYAGAELIRLVLGHPEFELVAITSNADAGQPLSAVYPSFAGVSDLVFTTHDAPELKSCDAVFLAVPHTAAMAQVPALLASGVSCFDLSADYRLSDPAVFEAWYAAAHTSPELLKTRAFGLPELFCQDLETAASSHADGKPVLVACAGCYPTATSLAAAPAVRAGWVAENGPVIVDAISGVTGAGKSCNARTHFCSADENLEAYGVGKHRHTPEIEQILGLTDRIVFTPHLAPLKRGLLSTVTLPLTPQASTPWLLRTLSTITSSSMPVAPLCACSTPTSSPRRLRSSAPTPLRLASRSTSAQACWWRRAPSTICARALRAKQSSAPISSLALTSDEACPQWRARCSTFDC